MSNNFKILKSINDYDFIIDMESRIGGTDRIDNINPATENKGFNCSTNVYMFINGDVVNILRFYYNNAMNHIEHLRCNIAELEEKGVDIHKDYYYNLDKNTLYQTSPDNRFGSTTISIDDKIFYFNNGDLKKFLSTLYHVLNHIKTAHDTLIQNINNDIKQSSITTIMSNDDIIFNDNNTFSFNAPEQKDNIVYIWYYDITAEDLFSNGIFVPDNNNVQNGRFTYRVINNEDIDDVIGITDIKHFVHVDNNIDREYVLNYFKSLEPMTFYSIDKDVLNTIVEKHVGIFKQSIIDLV